MDTGGVDVLLLLSSHLQTGNSDVERPKWGSLSLCWGQGEGGSLQGKSGSAKLGSVQAPRV